MTEKTLVLGLVFLASPMFAAGPDKAKYQTAPFLAEGILVPEVLMVISKDHKMFQQAYSPLIDFDDQSWIVLMTPRFTVIARANGRPSFKPIIVSAGSTTPFRPSILKLSVEGKGAGHPYEFSG